MTAGSRHIAWMGFAAVGLGVAAMAAGWVQAGAQPPPSSPQQRASPTSDPVRSAAPPAPSLDLCERLLDVIAEIESAGRAGHVGAKGERGLVQITPRTWSEMTRRLYGRPISFAHAFEAEKNREVGLGYLRWLRTYLALYRDRWQADEVTLLLGAYNAGPDSVRDAGFRVDLLPRSTQAYIARGRALYDSPPGGPRR